MTIASRYEEAPFELDKYIEGYQVRVKSDSESLAKTNDTLNRLIITLQVPKSDYDNEQIQTILNWASSKYTDAGYYRDFEVVTEFGENEQSIVFSGAESTYKEKGSTEEDMVWIELTVDQKRDRLPGAVFGEDLEETYQLALEKGANPPTLNIVVPVVYPAQPDVTGAAAEYAAGDKEYVAIFYTNGKEITRAAGNGGFSSFTLSDGSTKDWDYYRNMGYRFIKQVKETALVEKGFIWKRYVEGTTYIYGEFRRTLGSVAVKKNGAAVGTPIGAYMEDGACIVISPKSLFEKLGYDTTENTKSYTLANKGEPSLPKLTIAKYEYGGATMTNVKVKTVNDTVKSQINSTLDWDENTKTATVSFNAGVVVPKDTKGREITFPDTIKGKLNGEDITLKPNENWYSFQYSETGTVKDSEGRHKIVVGPKILDSNYPDDGKVQTEDFGVRSLHVRVDVVLVHKVSGEIKTIECIAAGLKAHTYNLHPDKTEGRMHKLFDYNQNITASFEVENGLIQTGIAYPNCWNAQNDNEQDGPIAVDHINSSSIEFWGTSTDFGARDYKLVKIIIPD